MEMNFTLVDEFGQPIEVFCEVFERGESVYWRAWLYGFATLLETLDGHAPDDTVIAGQIQAEIMLRGIRAHADPQGH
ncbi:hypothetical protein SAMN04487785_102238 [Dyella jiangningensis]|nr:hypothetical protein BDW41_102238 [Dyella sp. AtDHG13]SDJ48556.1 hypothetical protein SAMN04487785_102238 [Dyella jiangningensis]